MEKLNPHSPLAQFNEATHALTNAQQSIQTNYHGKLHLSPHGLGQVELRRGNKGDSFDRDHELLRVLDGAEAAWIAEQLIRVYGLTGSCHTQLRVAIRELEEAVTGEHGVDTGAEISHALDNLRQLL